MTGRLVFDDAAVFPPGNLPLEEAIRAHHQHRAAPYAALVGPLVVPYADLGRLHGAGPLEIAVVVPDARTAALALDRARRIPGIRLVALEVTDTTVAELQAGIGDPAGVAVFVELPRDDRRQLLIDSLVGTPYAAKLRTGGTRADLYPDELELAEALVALAAAGVPFKATAGLHHALRNTDPETGFEQHGFLSVLAATEAARAGATVQEVAAVLADRGGPQLDCTDSLLRSIGTCSITDPVADLTELGVLGVLDLAVAR